MAKRPDCSEQALTAARELVAYIEFFRSHGTGATVARYPEDDSFGGYDNIVRRAKECAAKIDTFDGRADLRAAEQAA